ncbi:MAG: helix-turn-helix domain-containing protein [Verrucomicrobiota bacterium]
MPTLKTSPDAPARRASRAVLPALAPGPSSEERAADVVRRLAGSAIFRAYEAAFNESTRLPLSLRPLQIWRHALAGRKRENPFCAMIARSNRSCAACLRVQQEIAHDGGDRLRTATCFAGLSETAVPVSIGSRIVGFLQTGQIATGRLSQAKFARVTDQMAGWGATIDPARLKAAYLQTPVLSARQYRATIALLEIFSDHLSLRANQILVQQEGDEPPLVGRARRFIRDHYAGSITLAQIAKILNVSTFYFCKVFKSATGLTFTDYLARTRVEKAKTLLLDPHLRVSEVGYRCGFFSVTHFNYVFRRIVGHSPTAFRRAVG